VRILIIGASGLVGSHVLAEAMAGGHDVMGTYRNCPQPSLVKLDLEDEAATATLVEAFKPDWIVHAAGWTWVDGCEKDSARAFRENCDQPVMLAKLCAHHGCGLVYFSTTYIFDGNNGPYSETDIPNPINVYAQSKWAGEQGIQRLLTGQALVPRVICVWGREAQQKNFVYQVFRSLRESRVMRLPSDQLGNPTWAGDIAWWVIRLMGIRAKGVWNLAGEETHFSRLQWYRAIRSGLGADPSAGYEEISTGSLGQAALRPLNASALTDRINAVFPKKVRSPENCSDIVF
jgi:dTDP-4-dehydrorhamnose reductase